MIFNSTAFFIFLPVLFIVHHFIPQRFRRMLLLSGSYLFYSFLLSPALPATLAVITLISYFCGKIIHASEEQGARKTALWFGICASISVLIYFKYLPFLASNANSVLKLIQAAYQLPMPQPMLSIAISFFVFQAISYMADIYFKVAAPEESLSCFALYMSFFPKLLQGPIERAGGLLPQLKNNYQFDYDRVRSGMILFAWGLFKKVVIADRLALYVNPVYSNVHDYTGISLVLATYAYALQIYFDFAGYTDMARGVARMFGIELTENFKSPYLATSCAEFWRRWHISLSRWILEYIFEPLQMRFRNNGKFGTSTALLLTFIACGIWHGASWGFIIWGFLHGVYLVSSTYYRPYQKKLHKALAIEKTQILKIWQTLVTFNLVCFTFIFFRATSLQDAWYIITNLFQVPANVHEFMKLGGFTYFKMNILMGVGFRESVILAISSLQIFLVFKLRHLKLTEQSIKVRWSTYYILVFSIIYLYCNNGKSFVYFDF